MNRRRIKKGLKRTLEILWGYPLYFFSYIIPRHKDKWLVGSHIGFAGNAKYFYLEAIIRYNQHCYWIASSIKEMQDLEALGLPVYYRWSLKGIYHCLTAYKYIFSFHVIDINFWTSGGTKRINLWHGIGIKNIEFQIHRDFLYNEKNILARIYVPYIFKKPHLFLSTSPLMTEHFQKCFRIEKENCITALYPRCRLFFWPKEQLISFIRQYEPEYTWHLINKFSRYEEVYLYMPTWRDTHSDFITTAGFDFFALNEVLKKNNSLFMLKLHPATNLNYTKFMGLSNIICLDNKIDIYPVLPFTSVLITDYSSVYYDYILMGDKQILLFPFDYNDYIINNRDLAFDFDEYTPGKRVYSFVELLRCIERKESLQNDKVQQIKDLFWDYGMDDVYKCIEELE